MKRMLWLIPAAVLVLTAGFVSADSDRNADPEKGKIAFEGYCVKCHDSQRTLSRTKDRDGWEWTVKTMSRYHDRRTGSPIPEDDQKDIIAYLLRNAGGN